VISTGKSVISIYIESLINEKATELRLNKSKICNEALKLAVLGVEHKGNGTMETAFSNFLQNKIEMEKDKGLLKKVFRITQKNRNVTSYHAVLKEFCEKYGVEWSEAVSIAQGKESALSNPKEKD